MLKKSLSFLLALSLLLTLIACGSQPAPQETDSTPVTSTEASVPSQEEIPGTTDESAGSAESTDNSTKSEIIAQVESKPVSNQPSSTPATAQVSTESVAKEEPASSVTTQAEPISKPESTPSSQPSSSTASTAPPIYEFKGETMDELIAWLKGQQSNNNSADAGLNNTSTDTPPQTLLVPKSVKKGLIQDNYIAVKSNTYYYYFRTYESTKNHENQIYRIKITPLSSTTENWVDAIDDSPSDFNLTAKTGFYRGIDYIYVDGHEKTDQQPAGWATAWFVYDNHLISIHALWANAYKPWNNEWFDYFEFENIEL